MAVSPELLVIDSRSQPVARCLVCGNDVSAGEGVTAQYQGRTVRFKCAGCYGRFQADPERYLAGSKEKCCGGGHGHSPASEWRCD